MAHEKNKTRGLGPYLGVVWVFACIGLFAVLWGWVNPRLIYDAFGTYMPYPAFSTESGFRQFTLSHAGGPVEYAAGFFSQWFYSPAAGALILTSVALALSLAISQLIHLAGGPAWSLWSLATFVGVLAIYVQYRHPLAMLLSLTVALWAAVDYERIPLRASLPRAGVFALFAVVLYYLAGAVVLLFGVVAGLWELFAKRRWVLGPAVVLIGAAVPWVAGAGFFYLTLHEAYSLLWPFDSTDLVNRNISGEPVLVALFLYPVAIVLATTVMHRLFGRSETPSGKAAGKKKNPDRPAPTAWRRAVLRMAIPTVVLMAATVAGLWHLPRVERRVLFQMVRFTRDREWQSVLQAAQDLPPVRYDFFCNHMVNLALYHSGRLADSMFSFPQSRSGLLLLTEEVSHTPPKYWMLAETLLDLGNLNLAEQWAYETFETQGNCPWVLELLAAVYAAKEQPEVARIFLNRLSGEVMQRRRAEYLLAALEAGDDAPSDWRQRFLQARRHRWTENSAHTIYSEEFSLTGILRSQPHNLMAFEYLMAYYLLTKQTGRIAENLYRLDELGYQEIPRHYQEAIMIHSAVTRQPVNLYGRRVDPEIERRFREFSDRYREVQKQKRDAARVLARDFGNSYFYYHMFSFSGVGATE